MDWALIFTIVGFFVGNILTVVIALAVHHRWQQDRQDKRFAELWAANDIRINENVETRKDFQGAIARIERDLSETIQKVASSLNDHKVEDARIYVTRAELGERIESLNGEIKGLREDIRHVVSAMGGK